MEASTVEAWLGMVPARLVSWWSVAQAVLGLAPWTDGDPCHPLGQRCCKEAGDHCDAAGFIFFFFSLCLPLTT
jgi:hypothetical protein